MLAIELEAASQRLAKLEFAQAEVRANPRGNRTRRARPDIEAPGPTWRTHGHGACGMTRRYAALEVLQRRLQFMLEIHEVESFGGVPPLSEFVQGGLWGGCNATQSRALPSRSCSQVLWRVWQEPVFSFP
jgi:hypothetical protein